MSDSTGPCCTRVEHLPGWFEALAVVRGLGLEVETVAVDEAVVRQRVAPHMRNPDGSVNGGYLLAVSDVVAGLAVVASGGPWTRSATADLSTHFMVPARGEQLRAEASVLRRGRGHVVPTVRILDGDRLCTQSTGTWVLR